MKTIGAYGLVRASVFVFLFGMILLCGVQAFGQEWTAEQKEVWKAVESSWENMKKGDVEAVLSVKRDDAVVWWESRPEPMTKEFMIYAYRNWFEYEKPSTAKIKPLIISIFGNFANVYYIFKYDGEKLKNQGRILETWVKEGDKWLQIGSLSASCNKNPPCPYSW